MPKFATFILAGLMMSASAHAQTAYTYEYDVHGRLIRVERGTGISSRVLYFLDALGNRTKVRQGNAAPVAVADGGFFETGGGPTGEGHIQALANDTDEDFPGDTLTITGLSGADSAYAQIAVNNTQIYFSAPEGFYNFTYHIQDSSGATSSAAVDVYIIDVCWWC